MSRLGVLLAVAIAVAKAEVSGAIITLLSTGAYLAGMLLVVRPLVIATVHAVGKRAVNSQTVMSVAVVGLLLSTLATEAAGIHAIFGAFLLGAIIPHDSAVA